MKINSVKPGVPKKATYLSLIAVVLFLAWLNYAVGYNHMPVKGTMVQLMNRTGGSAAFGAWASNRIKGRAGAQVSTMLLGCLIFIDDYFNCLTVGSVMRPVVGRCTM